MTYTTKYDQPDAQDTVALGFFWLNNTPYDYREVDFDEATLLEANVVANKIDGDWNMDLLAQVNEEILELGGDLSLTGQSEDEINALLKVIGPQSRTIRRCSRRRHEAAPRSIHRRAAGHPLRNHRHDEHERSLVKEPNLDLDANALNYICSPMSNTPRREMLSKPNPS